MKRSLPSPDGMGCRSLRMMPTAPCPSRRRPHLPLWHPISSTTSEVSRNAFRQRSALPISPFRTAAARSESRARSGRLPVSLHRSRQRSRPAGSRMERPKPSSPRSVAKRPIGNRSSKTSSPRARPSPIQVLFTSGCACRNRGHAASSAGGCRLRELQSFRATPFPSARPGGRALGAWRTCNTRGAAPQSADHRRSPRPIPGGIQPRGLTRALMAGGIVAAMYAYNKLTMYAFRRLIPWT